MKINVDLTKCCGHARCASVDDSLFELNDDGYMHLPQLIVPAGKETVARRGVRACPERALTLVEDDGSDMPSDAPNK
ncbi:MAG: ferredoxin [Pseudomonas sp.]|uniref:ferredoxin n=1 Tax=Pseudomonas sp. TaxID=306 RepID=UPI003981FBD8